VEIMQVVQQAFMAHKVIEGDPFCRVRPSKDTSHVITPELARYNVNRDKLTHRFVIGQGQVVTDSTVLHRTD
jgi:hypothetical protein